LGPITLFDKSFLQGLSVDESVWFDYFFLAVVCPVFYVETLADLAKTPREGRTSESEVRIIASKFPEMGGSPCMEYMELCVANLLGYDVPMDGRVIRPGGRRVANGSQTGVVYDESPEDVAFQRWQREEFEEVERLFATGWREAMKGIDLKQIAETFQSLGITPQTCRSISDAYDLANGIVSGNHKRFEQIVLAVRLLRIPPEAYQAISQRWQQAGCPPLSRFAPYTAFVVTIEIFFQIALAANLITTTRNSNRTDIAYLFYLPFCQAFVSSDRLHQRVVAPFLRADQHFVWGQDLKEDLGRINAHFLRLPESERELGVMRFAHRPPPDVSTVVGEVWGRFGLGSRSHNENLAEKMDPEAQKRLVERLTAFRKGQTLPENSIGPVEDMNMLSIERKVSGKKGSWWQVPKGLKDIPSPECGFQRRRPPIPI
jgi:hypothetical protein